MIHFHHFLKDRKPDGGITQGRGFTIAWQRGPLRVGDARIPPNGAFVEDVIEAVIDRLNHYQSTEFNCRTNANAIDHLRCAVEQLQSRFKDREERGVLGTHEQ